MRISTIGVVLALGLGCAPPLALAAELAGEVALITGRGTATNPVDGGIRDLAKGDPVFSGEVINASVNSYLNLKFADGSYVLLKPNTRFVIEEFHHATTAAPGAPAAPPPSSTKTPAPPPVAAAAGAGSSRAFFRLLRGGFRAVSGLIGKTDPNDYRVSTPVATIGIRGTDYLVILCDVACAKDPVLNAALPGGGGAADGGVVVGVIDGNVFVANQAGQQASLGQDQYLINLPNGLQVHLPFEPRFLRVDPIPNPTNVCSQ